MLTSGTTWPQGKKTTTNTAKRNICWFITCIVMFGIFIIQLSEDLNVSGMFRLHALRFICAKAFHHFTKLMRLWLQAKNASSKACWQAYWTTKAAVPPNGFIISIILWFRKNFQVISGNIFCPAVIPDIMVMFNANRLDMFKHMLFMIEPPNPQINTFVKEC